MTVDLKKYFPTGNARKKAPGLWHIVQDTEPEAEEETAADKDTGSKHIYPGNSHVASWNRNDEAHENLHTESCWEKEAGRSLFSLEKSINMKNNTYIAFRVIYIHTTENRKDKPQKTKRLCT